jgi:ATP-binding cassette subfamily C protein/ATP-binding cassette subfamily C exporter for protease/lipase/ATP-binding cassette subfamily C protein EexD
MVRTAPRGATQAQPPTALDEALRICRRAFVFVALFSFALNLLMLASPIYMLQVYDRVLTTGHYETLALITALALAALLILGALDALRAAVMNRIGGWLNARLGPELLGVSLRSRLLGDTGGGQPLRDLAQVQGFVGGQGLAVFFDAPWVPVFVVLVWLLHPILGLVAAGSAVLLFVMTILNDWTTRAPLTRATQAQIQAQLQAEQTIRNAEVVRAMGMRAAMVERWNKVNDAALEATSLAAERGGVFVGITKFLRFGVQVAILGVGALLVLRGELSSGGMVAASILLGRALAPVEQAMGAWKNFTQARLAYGRLQQRLAALPRERPRTELPEPKGSLAVERLTYQLPGSDRPVLQQVAFALEPGEALAIIGPSAAGKSTLCRHLVGIAQPSAGHVRLDGADVHHWDPERLGRHVGYLPQDVELFGGSVRENIARMGEGDDAEIVEAARLAHAHDMILKLPQGYDTQIGDAGARLSGGQRQRIGLARALFGSPCLVVLDEPNANLDQAGELALAAAVAELKRRGATIVIVSHRPSALQNVDKILFLKDGRVEAFGPRDEVLRQLQGQPRPTAAPAAAAPVRIAPVAGSLATVRHAQTG